MTCTQAYEGCRASADKPRHNHHTTDVNDTGEKCPSCGQLDWLLLFGGVLPTRLQCASCSHGLNLSEAIRRSQPAVPASYRGLS